nr:MAG TPA: hypothetical protein [Caudoviricetes sp.]
MIWNPPEKIKRLAAIWEPYAKEILEGNIENVPKEAIEAYEKDKAWAWEQEQ